MLNKHVSLHLENTHYFSTTVIHSWMCVVTHFTIIFDMAFTFLYFCPFWCTAFGCGSGCKMDLTLNIINMIILFNW